jgi:hypothetical protein
MGQLAIPIMIGAAVGGGSKLLQGKGIGDILKGAAIGGVGGAATGGIGSLLGGATGGAAAGGATGATAGATSLAPTTAAAFEASMGLPSSALISAGAPLASAMPTGAAMGLVQGAGGTMINPEYYSNILGNQVYKGGEGVLSNAIGDFIPSMSDLKQYATIDNLAGANAIASKFQPTPRSPAPQGRITEGQPMKGGFGQGGVEGLLAELQKRQQQQYQPISLL